MTIIDKIALLNLDEKEEKKAKEKFMAALSLISEEELRKRLGFLVERGVIISRAKDIKILVIPTEELEKKFSILDEIHETALYAQEPSTLALNVIDVYKKLKYCIQNGIKYEDGLDYDREFIEALRSEAKWKEFLEKRKVTQAPSLPNEIDFDERDLNNNLTDQEIEPLPAQDRDDITSFVDLANVDQELEEKTTNFDDLKRSLEEQMRRLDQDLTPDGSMYAPDYENGIGFGDITPESYGINPEEPARGGRR